MIYVRGGEPHHFSTTRFFSAGFIEMMMTILTSPPALSHHPASCLRRISISESPDSKTMVGQSVFGVGPGWGGILYRPL